VYGDMSEQHEMLCPECPTCGDYQRNKCKHDKLISYTAIIFEYFGSRERLVCKIWKICMIDDMLDEVEEWMDGLGRVLTPQ